MTEDENHIDLPDISRLHAEPRSNLSKMSKRQFNKMVIVAMMVSLGLGVLLALISNQLIYGFVAFIVMWVVIGVAAIKTADRIIGAGTTDKLDDYVKKFAMTTKIFGIRIAETNELLNEDANYGTARKE